MFKRLVGLTAVVALALGGTAHAADFDAAEIQASIDKAVAAAGAQFKVAQSQPPAVYSPSAMNQIAEAALFEITGFAQTSLMQTVDPAAATQGRDVQVIQNATPELAESFWLAQQQIQEKNTQPPNSPPTGFKTRKVKGESVLFFEQKLVSTAGKHATNAHAALVDGRNNVHFQIIALNAAKARKGIRKWVAAYLQ